MTVDRVCTDGSTGKWRVAGAWRPGTIMSSVVSTGTRHISEVCSTYSDAMDSSHSRKIFLTRKK